MTILINCNGKFCYWRRKFQNTEAATGSVLKISQNSQENTYARVSFLIKVQASGQQLYYIIQKKKTPT